MNIQSCILSKHVIILFLPFSDEFEGLAGGTAEPNMIVDMVRFWLIFHKKYQNYTKEKSYVATILLILGSGDCNETISFSPAGLESKVTGIVTLSPYNINSLDWIIYQDLLRQPSNVIRLLRRYYLR